MADNKKPTPAEAEPTVTMTSKGKPQAAQKSFSEMSLDDMRDALQSGRMKVLEPQPHTLADTFTRENVEKFLAGEATWAELMGMTQDEAFGIAEYGYQLYKEGNLGDAKNVFEALVVGNPYEPYFHSTLGAIYQQLDMEHEALIEYGLAIELDARELNARVNRAELSMTKGDFEAAFKDLKEAMDIDPEAKQSAGQRAHALAAATKEVLDKLPQLLEQAKKGDA